MLLRLCTFAIRSSLRHGEDRRKAYPVPTYLPSYSDNFIQETRVPQDRLATSFFAPTDHHMEDISLVTTVTVCLSSSLLELRS
jgi:hypothetical protein